MKPGYQHTQIGYFIICAYSAALIFFGYLYLVSGEDTVLAIALGLISIALALFATLTVQVDERTIGLRFGIGLIQKRYPVDKIRNCRAVRNRW